MIIFFDCLTITKTRTKLLDKKFLYRLMEIGISKFDDLSVTYKLMKEVLLIAFSVGFILSIAIIVNNNHWQKPKFWLGMLILAFSFILMDAWGSIIDLSELIPIFGYTHNRCLMMIPISIWMYINGLVNFNKVQIGTFEKILFGFLFFELCLLTIVFMGCVKSLN